MKSNNNLLKETEEFWKKLGRVLPHSSKEMVLILEEYRQHLKNHPELDVNQITQEKPEKKEKPGPKEIILKKDIIWKNSTFKKTWKLIWRPIQIFEGKPYAEFIDIETNVPVDQSFTDFMELKGHSVKKKSVNYYVWVFDPIIQVGITCNDFMKEIHKLNNTK